VQIVVFAMTCLKVMKGRRESTKLKVTSLKTHSRYKHLV